MNESRNVYDLTNSELQEKLMNHFNDNFSKYSYKEDDWQKITEIIDNFNNNILETNFPLALYNETNFKLSEFKKVNEETKAQKIFHSIMDSLSKIGRGVGTFFKQTSFAYSILGLTLATVIFTTFIHILIANFLYPLLPDSVTPLMIESIIASIMFMVLKTWIFCDKENRNILFNYKTEIIKFVCTIPFYACIFLIFLDLGKNTFLEHIKFLFYPHLWLSAFTDEFVFSPMICLAINCLVPIGVYLLIRKKTEK